MMDDDHYIDIDTDNSETDGNLDKKVPKVDEDTGFCFLDIRHKSLCITIELAFVIIASIGLLFLY